MAQENKDVKGNFYVMNYNYEIIHCDELDTEFICKDTERRTCYSLKGLTAPCHDCPLKDYNQTLSSSIRKLMYITSLSCWIDFTMVPVQWPGEGDCILVSFRKLSDGDRHVFLNFDQEIKYDYFVEVDKKNNAYEKMYSEAGDSQIPASGDLTDYFETVKNNYILPEDRYAFSSFWNFDNIEERIEKFGFISEEFRVLDHGNQYQWKTFYVSSAYKGDHHVVYLCFTVASGKQYIWKDQDRNLSPSSALDPLTKLHNSGSFQVLAKHLLEQSDQSYGLVSFDVEHFKLFNEWYGTEKGDALLQYLARQIERIASSSHGLCARIGGDDFVIIMLKDQCDPHRIEKEIITWVQDYETDVIFLPAAGIYYIEDKTLPITLMCDRAVLALNSIKGNYSQRVAVYQRYMKQKLADEQEILFSVKKGLLQHEFEIYYQPKCSARTGKMIGAEALVRWNYPGKGMLAPNEFIPILESSGFIARLDYYVWEQVCIFLADRVRSHLDVVPISVNVSRMDIYQYHLTEVFEALIEKYGLATKLLEIEITESAYTEDFDQLIKEVAKLRKAGFLVLMDDFGSGYSSLNMLKDIEIDVLKIDMKFLDANEQCNNKSSSILESIIQMGKWLGLRMIAEGVETKDQVDNLLNLDCEYMQGYYFYKPMPQAKFEQLLQQAERIDPRGILARRLPSIELDDLFHKDITSEAMLNNILGGVAVYEITDDHELSIKMVNDGYYRMTGCNAVDLCERSDKIIQQVHADDLHIVWDIFHRSEKAVARGASGIFRRYRLSGEIMWMHLHAFFLRKQGNKKVYYGAVSDYSELMNLQKDIMRLLETIPGNVIELRVKDGQVLSQRIVCASLAALHGYSKDEYCQYIKTKSSINIIHEEDRARMRYIMTHPDEWKKETKTTFRTYTKDGKQLWLEQQIVYIETEEGIDIYNQLCTDITLLKNQEAELMESQVMLQEIIGITESCTSASMIAKENRESAAFLFARSIPGGMIGGYCEKGFPIYFANEEMIHMLGYDSYQDMCDGIHGYVENTIYEKDRRLVSRDIGPSFYEGLAYTTRYRLVRKDQTLLWVVDKGRVVKAEDGRLAIISCCIDISETMNARFRQQEAEEGITLLNSLVPGGYHQCYQTPDYKFKHISDRFLTMLGFTREDIRTRFENRYLNMILPEDRETVGHILSEKREDNLFMAQYRIYTATGMMWVKDQTRLIRHGKECYFAGIIQDISDMVTMQEKIEKIIMNTPGDVFSIEGNKLVYHSYNLASAMGYELEEYKRLIQETNGSIFTDPRDRNMIHQTFRQMSEKHADIDLIFRSVAKDHKTRYIHLKATYHDTSGAESAYYGIMIDATSSKRKEQELKISQQMYAHIVKQANLNVWEYDVEKDCLKISEHKSSDLHHRIGLIERDECGNYMMNNFKHALNQLKNDTPVMFYLLSNLKEKIENRAFDDMVIDLSVFLDQNCWIKAKCDGIYNDQELVKVIGFFQDITGEKEKELLAQREKQYAQFDSLTGIYNRRMGEVLIQNALRKQNYPHSAFMLIDLDDFKQVNDQYGHIKGDYVLKKVASCINAYIENEDIFCRLGGDEFLVYYAYEDQAALIQKVQKIKDCLNEHHCSIIGDQDIHISIGIALSPQHGTDFHALYERADQALYDAKAKGKNICIIYE